MADSQPIHPGVPEEVYHTLGRKTLMIFVLERVNAAAVFLVASAVFFVLADQPFLKKTPVGDMTKYVNLASALCLALFAIVLIGAFFVAWLVYTHYRYYLGENSLKIRRGIFNKEEIAIPYRQIQDVDITRDITFQMLGLSRIVILTAGHDDEKTSGDESEGILPALDKDLAEWLQSQLLERANVQKVTETPPDPAASAGASITK